MSNAVNATPKCLMHSFNIQQGATPVIMTILQRSVGKWPMASSFYALGFLQITTPIRAVIKEGKRSHWQI